MDNVRFTAKEIVIKGRATMLLCGSLFYFRLPRCVWKERLTQLKSAGYNCIDVYVPWNYHETSPGVWDFTGEKDLASFLAMAADIGLYVMARPGPYICSEWDGGSIPAWLLGDTIRDDVPHWMDACRAWYERIMPLLAGFEVGKGGSIVCVQIENEYDFYTPPLHRASYIEKLRDIARAQGISVPLIACAGQGDIVSAGGLTKDVVPAFNFYPSPADEEFPDRVLSIQKEMEAIGFPLVVSETSRQHALLRLEVLCGAKMVSPYNQVGGTDFGFTTSVNNWGNPGAFMASDYSFGGLLSVSGELDRQETIGARMLANAMSWQGMAQAKPDTTLPCSLIGDGRVLSLALPQGGYIVGVIGYNAGATDIKIQTTVGTFPQETCFQAPAMTCPYAMVDIPIEGGKILFASAELQRQDGANLTFAAWGDAEVHLQGCAPVVYRGQEVLEKRDQWSIRILSCEQAADLEMLDQANITYEAQEIQETVSLSLLPDPTLHAIEACAPLEELGGYRGFGFYHAKNQEQNAVGIILHDAADVISLYADQKYIATATPFGANVYLPIPQGFRQVSIRAEIWGHSNFDDPRAPALSLASLRGISGATAVTSARKIQSNWRYRDAFVGHNNPILVGLGGWMNHRAPTNGTYEKTITLSKQENSRHLLHCNGILAQGHVHVNGTMVGTLSQVQPWLDLSAATVQGENTLSIELHSRYNAEKVGEVYLYEGVSLQQWQAAAMMEEQTVAWVQSAEIQTEVSSWPMEMQAGDLGVVSIDLQNIKESLELEFSGTNAKLTVLYGDCIVGRLWLSGEACPTIKGGRPTTVALPGEWLQTNLPLRLLIEAVGGFAQIQCPTLRKTSIWKSFAVHTHLQ